MMAGACEAVVSGLVRHFDFSISLNVTQLPQRLLLAPDISTVSIDYHKLRDRVLGPCLGTAIKVSDVKEPAAARQIVLAGECLCARRACQPLLTRCCCFVNI